MASKKPKPATAGEKIEMKRFGISLHDVRTLPVSKRVKTIDRAIARAVRKERERCVNIGKLWVASEVHDADMVHALANGDVL